MFTRLEGHARPPGARGALAYAAYRQCIAAMCAQVVEFIERPLGPGMNTVVSDPPTIYADINVFRYVPYGENDY